MNSLNYCLYICIMAGLGMMLPVLERRTRELILFMMIGVTCCLFISEINNLILKAYHEDYFYVTTTYTPITEEIIKTLPILYLAVVRKNDRRTLISDAFALGVGFALFENVVYILQRAGIVSISWALLRSFGSGMVHGLCSVMVGYGIYYIGMRRKLFTCGTFSLILVAETYHAIYNLLTLSEHYYAGFLLPVLTYIPLILFLRASFKSKTDKKVHNSIKE